MVSSSIIVRVGDVYVFFKNYDNKKKMSRGNEALGTPKYRSYLCVLRKKKQKMETKKKSRHYMKTIWRRFFRFGFPSFLILFFAIKKKQEATLGSNNGGLPCYQYVSSQRKHREARQTDVTIRAIPKAGHGNLLSQYYCKDSTTMCASRTSSYVRLVYPRRHIPSTAVLTKTIITFFLSHQVISIPGIAGTQAKNKYVDISQFLPRVQHR